MGSSIHKYSTGWLKGVEKDVLFLRVFTNKTGRKSLPLTVETDFMHENLSFIMLACANIRFIHRVWHA
ncbi:hypothetical protein BJP41_04360 [Candidatus Williamhamiltonella defendens]|uniref:Uncharacterized protein n=1 Tax=Candidatus Williamhamiltonella defendens TaxID=138072 RepID=A0A2D3T206_9ENTR|nr:hypothetical protein CJJ18_03755 [Candidatus Hamiltonella defensa]ATW29703.1 hypothetical protein BJP41_04360 [Candidatus Hamiltonella defensa]